MSLFPEITPFATHMLPVSDGHTLYVARFGNPEGIPAVVLHGGPGSGFGDKAPRRFDPAIYHIICFDQRGAGRSTPTGSLVANTTQHLVQDVESLRSYLNIEKWVVYGSSWGSTLGLAYAQSHPEKILSLVLGGIFLGTEEEISWFNNPLGLPRLRWQEFSELQNLFPGHPTGAALDKAAYQALLGPDAAFARRVALAFGLYESMACFPNPDRQAALEHLNTDEHLVAHIAIELHYFVNNCFLIPGQLLNNFARIAHLPIQIVQGELDFVCPPVTAQKLHAVLPTSTLHMVPMGGHYTDPGLEAARVAATKAIAQSLGHRPSA